MQNDFLRRNPSRETCENIIKKILSTEIAENGRNTHFKFATDFMSYFESLYPASEGLTRQVQRAIKSLDMARDESGYFIIDKTKEEYSNEQELLSALSIGSAHVTTLDNVQTLFIELKPALAQYVMSLINSSEALSSSCITMLQTYNGIIIYTANADLFKEYLKNFITN